MYNIVIYDNIINQQKIAIVNTIESLEIEQNLSQSWRCRVVLPSDIDITWDNMIEVIEVIEQDWSFMDNIIFSGYITNIKPRFGDIDIIDVTAKDMNSKADDIWILTNGEYTDTISNVMQIILNTRETITGELYTFLIDEDLDITITEDLKSWVSLKVFLDNIATRLDCFWQITKDREIQMKKIIGEDKRVIFTYRDDDTIRDDDDIRDEWPQNPILLQYDAFNPSTNNITNIDREIRNIDANIVLWVWSDKKNLVSDIQSIQTYSWRFLVYKETDGDIVSKTEARLSFAKKIQAVVNIDVYVNLDLSIWDYVSYSVSNTNKYLNGEWQVYVAKTKTNIQNGEKITTIWLSEDIVKEVGLIEKIRQLDRTLSISIV